MCSRDCTREVLDKEAGILGTHDPAGLDRVTHGIRPTYGNWRIDACDVSKVTSDYYMASVEKQNRPLPKTSINSTLCRTADVTQSDPSLLVYCTVHMM